MPTPHRRRTNLTALAAVVAAAVVLTTAAPAAATHPRPADPEPTVVSYSEDEAAIANPARGFYHHTETHSRVDGSGWTPLAGDALAGFRAEGVSQVLRVVYLERYVDADLDATLLDALAADFATARAAGVSIILRFAYAQGGDWPYSPPYGDASQERVLAHIAQLTPLLRANADVIAVMQNGFIGLWGEGYYTDHFVADPADPGVVTDEDWEARATVLDALLEALPDSRMVQVRTMQWKQRTLDRPTGAEGALPADDAFDGSALARTGHHNDCFLASPDDFGTFLSDPITLDQEYLEAETRFLPMGGETCTVNPPRSGWESASAEMARYHFSYLNRDYNTDVLNSWGAANLTEVAKQLGYRFVLEESRVVSGDAPSLEIDVRNEGWAAPYNPRPVSVVLDGAAGAVTVPLDADARTWAPGETVTLTVPLSDVPAGSYTASLALPAPETSVAADPRFAIRTANVGTWDAARGLNQLQQQVTIGSAPKAVSKPAVRVWRDDVRVTWHPARKPSAAPVTAYTVTLTSAAGQVLTQDAAEGSRTVTFSDVPAGRWRATVVATNVVGSSAPSKPSATAVVHRSHHHR
ncbi:DUF4832 domain-containing protein [Microbacterium sp. RD1]|uniref:DUF4832 domain-containing protein n=1 Tax=Microbacterium sp. RD1 TaxID=3457313 RepID=UPI003FA56356